MNLVDEGVLPPDELDDRIEAARKRESNRLMHEPRSWEECVARAIKAKENSDELY